MTNGYLYGAYGILAESVTQQADEAVTVPAYVGTLPVNLVRGYEKLVNKPIMLANYEDAQKKVGISDDWNAFTLCEAIEAHFNNKNGNIGPVYVVNVLNPEIHKVADKKTETLAFTNRRAIITNDKIILDTLALEDKTEGVDYEVAYDFNAGNVVITCTGEDFVSVNASYNEIDAAAVTETDVIGGKSSKGIYSGLSVIRSMYPTIGVYPDLIAAPGWSEIPSVYAAMVNCATKINGHWDAFVLADIPLSETSMDKAAAWKKLNGYTSERSKVFWPQIKSSTGKIYHLSTQAAVEFMRADSVHDGIPMETCGNKEIDAVSCYFGESSENQGFDCDESRVLTSEGIATAVFWSGNWVLWGDETAAYESDGNFDPRAAFDVNIRMLLYITNSFQEEWGTVVDKPFTIQLKDTIINKEQEKLDALVAMGALYGHPQVQFISGENSLADIRNGHFRWDIAVTPTPPMKSASAYVAYTDAGFAAVFE